MVARLVAIGGEWAELRVATIFVLAIWLLLFTASYWITVHRKVFFKWKLYDQNRNNVSKHVSILAIVSSVGALLIAYDFAVLRGYGFTTNVELIRISEVAESQERVGGSFFSGIGRLMTPAIIVAWNIHIVCKNTTTFFNRGILYFATIFVLWQQITFEGGRFAVAALILSTTIAWHFRVRTFNKSNSINYKLLIILLITFYFFLKIFAERAEIQSANYSTLYYLFSQNFSIDASRSILSDKDDMSIISFTSSMLWIYLTQAFNELDSVLHAENINHAFGLYQAPHFGQAFSILSGIPLKYDVFVELPNPGTYITFLGANYVDFSYFGALVSAAVLGFACGMSSNALRKGVFTPLSVGAPIFLVIAIFSPIYSMIPNVWPCFIYLIMLSFLRIKR